MKKFNEYITERKKYKLSEVDSKELRDFLLHVEQNVANEPNLLRAAYDRIYNILTSIKDGKYDIKSANDILLSIYNFVEGGRSNEELKDYAHELYLIDMDEYDKLQSIISLYNLLKNKLQSKYKKMITVFNIKGWCFDLDGIEEADEEIMESSEDKELQEFFMKDDVSWNEKEKLKDQLPQIHQAEINTTDDRDWKIGDVALIDDKHYVIVEGKSHEEYCDFGCCYISEYLDKNPDIDEEKFSEYVSSHNKADRDSGELQDICKEEIERLGKEFNKK